LDRESRRFATQVKLKASDRLVVSWPTARQARRIARKVT